MTQSRSIFGPLLLIAIGTIWILIAQGYIPSSNLWALTYIWPYLLIAAGVGLILRAYWKYANLFIDVIVIGGTLLSILFAPQLGWDEPSSTVDFVSETLYLDQITSVGPLATLGPVTKGSGTIVTEERQLEDFFIVDVNYPVRMSISQGDEQSVTVTGDDNVLPGLITEVQDDTLRIYYDPAAAERVNPTELVEISIVVKELYKVDFATAGQVTVDGMEISNLETSITGAGNIYLNNIDVTQLSANLSGAGSMTASGKAQNLLVTISGFGSFDGKQLHCQTANVNLSGAGSATVWVDDQLDVKISGAGSVNYYGSPNVDKKISGVGTVKHAGNK
jgi:hypothetical protein